MLALSESDRVILALREDKGHWQFRQLPAIGLFLDLQFVDADEDGIEDIILADSSGDHIEIVFGPLWDAAEEVGF
jgi:hypothetical protein